jgi:hypothetical protein
MVSTVRWSCIGRETPKLNRSAILDRPLNFGSTVTNTASVCQRVHSLLSANYSSVISSLMTLAAGIVK